MALVQARIDSRIKVGKGRKEDCQGAKPTRCQSSHGDIWSLLNIILALPVGTASVERSFSHMKQSKTRLLNDANLAHLMRIAIEGPELSSVNFDEVLEVFQEKNHRIQL